MRWRVVWGLSETMLTLAPQIRLTSDDLPTFGRPTNVTNPERTPGCLAPRAAGRHTFAVRSAQNGARSSRLRILPEPVLGSSSSQEIERGTL